MKSFQRLNLKSPLYRKSKSPAFIKPKSDDQTDLLFQRVCCPNCRYLFKVINNNSNNENQNIHSSKESQARKLRSVRQGQSDREISHLQRMKNLLSPKIDNKLADESCQTSDKYLRLTDSKASSRNRTPTPIKRNLSPSTISQNKKNISIYDIERSRKQPQWDQKGHLKDSNLKRSKPPLYQPTFQDRSKSRTPVKGTGRLSKVQTPKKTEKSLKSFSPNRNQDQKLFDGNGVGTIKELALELVKSDLIKSQFRCLKEVLEQAKDDLSLPSFCKMLLLDPQSNLS